MEQQGEIPLKFDKNLTVHLTATVEELNKPLNLPKMFRDKFNEKVEAELIRIGAIPSEGAAK